MILTFDLSKKCTAWAVTIGDELIEYGTIGWLPKHRTSTMFLGLREEISRILKVYEGNGTPIERMGYEHAAFQRGMANEIFHVLAAAVKVSAHEAGIPCHTVTSSYVKALIGKVGNADKPTMIRAVNRLTGLDLDPNKKTPDSDIADAIAVGFSVRHALIFGVAKLAA